MTGLRVPARVALFVSTYALLAGYSATQPGRTGQRFDLPYAIVGPLAAGHWVVESAGFQAGFDVP